MDPLASTLRSVPPKASRPHLRPPLSGVEGGAVAPSAARAVADVLREEILAHAEGHRLGSEAELMQRLAISRPTLRQAARLLEAEQLLEVRRGIRGGLFGCKPTARGVVHLASVYLRAEGTTLVDLTRTYHAVMAEVLALAASNPDAQERATLLAFVDGLPPVEGSTTDRRAFAWSRVEFGRRAARLTGSPTLVLFLDVVSEVGRVPGGEDLFADAAMMEAARRGQRAQAEAVRDGDADRAVAHSRRAAVATIAWAEEHHGDARLGA